jgi:hypothetical protein
MLVSEIFQEERLHENADCEIELMLGWSTISTSMFNNGPEHACFSELSEKLDMCDFSINLTLNSFSFLGALQ